MHALVAQVDLSKQKICGKATEKEVCGNNQTCVITDPVFKIGTCSGQLEKSSPTLNIPTFDSPTTATSFSGFMCGVTNLVSEQLLPPLAVLAMLVVGFMFLVSGGDPGKTNAAKQALFFTLAGTALLVLAPGIVALISDLLGGFSVAPLACGGPAVTNTIISALVNLVNWFSWFVAAVSTVMGLYGGFLYMTAGTDPARAVQGSRVLSFTIIGIAVSVIAFSIIALVKQLFI